MITHGYACWYPFPLNTNFLLFLMLWNYRWEFMFAGGACISWSFDAIFICWYARCKGILLFYIYCHFNLSLKWILVALSNSGYFRLWTVFDASQYAACWIGFLRGKANCIWNFCVTICEVFSYFMHAVIITSNMGNCFLEKFNCIVYRVGAVTIHFR